MPRPTSTRAVSPLEAHELAVKFYVADSVELQPRDFIPIFHQWIQKGRLEGELMIDVADYSHVHRGPGVLLVCHEGQYGLDQGEGRLGLLYARKRRSEGDARSRLAGTFRAALRACQLLEAEPALAGRLQFRYHQALFKIQNRLLAPPTAESFEAVREELEAFLGELYRGTGEVRIEETREPKGPFAVRIEASGAPELDRLLSRLEV